MNPNVIICVFLNTTLFFSVFRRIGCKNHPNWIEIWRYCRPRLMRSSQKLSFSNTSQKVYKRWLPGSFSKFRLDREYWPRRLNRQTMKTLGQPGRECQLDYSSQILKNVSSFDIDWLLYPAQNEIRLAERELVALPVTSVLPLETISRRGQRHLHRWRLLLFDYSVQTLPWIPRNRIYLKFCIFSRTSKTKRSEHITNIRVHGIPSRRRFLLKMWR